MLNKYPSYKKGEVSKIFDKFSNKDKQEIEEYLKYRQARSSISQNKLKDIKRVIIQFKHIIGDYNSLTLKELRNYLALLNTSDKTAYTRNDIKVNIKSFLKWKFKDWSKRFLDLEDIRLSSNSKNEKKLNSKSILSKKDIEKIMKTETKMFYKAFFITQYEAGLRTKEVRHLKWSDIKFNIDKDISEVNIYATKTQKARTIFVKEATFYLKKLKEEQEYTENKGVYIFHSKKDKNKPIDKSTISVWFRNLTKKALGKELWCYLLRHSRGTELYRLAKQNKIAKDTAIQFMGHSEDMSHFYTHLDTEEIKTMLKEQVYKLEDLPEETKHQLVEHIELLDKRYVIMLERLREIEKHLKLSKYK